MACIEVKELQKSFILSTPRTGILGSFRRDQRLVKAVQSISFSIESGERVAFIGPNGAGKSTTVKMLCGILSPTAGQLRVQGLEPWRARETLSYQIGIVFGNRSQLWPHLPVRDSFELLGAIFKRPKEDHKKRVISLCTLLELNTLLDTPANRLSLGERMRCELVASLLHSPKVLFLDEPTIGLDVSARTLLREYMRRLSENEGVTILLTSHDTGDIEEICQRVLVINHGSLILDQSVSSLRRGYIQRKRIRAIFDGQSPEIKEPGIEVVKCNDKEIELSVNTSIASVDRAVRLLLQSTSVADLTIEDPPLEDTIMEIYRTQSKEQL